MGSRLKATHTTNQSFMSTNFERRDGFFPTHFQTIVISYIVLMSFIAYFRSNTNQDQNILYGYLSVIFLVLILGTLVLPDGYFTRPHPAFWRFVFALSLVYLMTLFYILFQNHKTIKSIIYWFFPNLESVTDVFQKPYAINCSDYTLRNLLSKTDVYTFGHFFGWIVKALVVRHYGVCWLLSITWEVTELAFANLLPFSECWWDSIVLDVLLTNGLGIYIGMLILKIFNLETYEWESFKEEQMAHQESREALLQLSTETRDVMESFDHLNTYVRVLTLSLFNIIWQVIGLNTFFQMNIFDIPADHPLALARMILIILIAGPTVKEYLAYISQRDITKSSARFWVFLIILFLEIMVNIKYEPKIIANLQISYLVLWFIIQLFLCILCLAFSIYLNKRTRTFEPETCIEKANYQV